MVSFDFVEVTHVYMSALTFGTVTFAYKIRFVSDVAYASAIPNLVSRFCNLTKVLSQVNQIVFITSVDKGNAIFFISFSDSVDTGNVVKVWFSEYISQLSAIS